MSKNESGFTYPLTLCMVIIFALFVTTRVEGLLMERKMLKETESILKQEYYMMDAVKKTEKTLQSIGPVQLNGTYQYSSGHLSYHSDAPVGKSVKITFSLQLDSGLVITGYGYYDTSAKKMVKWVEMN